MIKYGFCVLNYNNFEDTIECVSSLLMIRRNDYHVLIIDNNSQNDSVHHLKSLFSASTKVSIVASTANLGYSGGNNLGIKWFLSHGIHRIIIATNDTVLISKNILDIFDDLDLKRVGIVGPHVKSLDGSPQNPTSVEPGLLYFLNLFFYQTMSYVRNILYRFIPEIKQQRLRSVENSRRALATTDGSSQKCRLKTVYMLHGCFFYLTEAYFEKLGLLDDSIFMYSEEDLLAWKCEKCALSRLFVPCVTVLHKEQRSVELAYNAGKECFKELNSRRSLKHVTAQIGAPEFISFLVRRRLHMIKKLVQLRRK